MINTQYTQTQGLQFWKDTLWDNPQYHQDSQEHKDFLLEVLAPISYYIHRNKCIGRWGQNKLGKIIHSRLVSIINYFALTPKHITKEQKQNLLEVFYWYSLFQKVIFNDNSLLREFTPLKDVYSHLKINLVAAEMAVTGKESFYNLVHRCANRYVKGEFNNRALLLQASQLLEVTQDYLRNKSKEDLANKSLKDTVVDFFKSPGFTRIGIVRHLSAPVANQSRSAVDIMISNISLKSVLENKCIGYLPPSRGDNKVQAVCGLYLDESIKVAEHNQAVEKFQLEEDKKRVAHLLSQMSATDRDLLERYFKNKLT